MSRVKGLTRLKITCEEDVHFFFLIWRTASNFLFIFSSVATLVFERGAFGPEMFSYRGTSPLRTFHTRRLQYRFLWRAIWVSLFDSISRVVCRVDGILRRERRGS